MFRSGDVLAVIDKLESSLGWWKAMRGNRIGYIPKVRCTDIVSWRGKNEMPG